MQTKHWWSDNAEESFWCEITDRKDIGADLKCPQTDETGARYWSYSLIREIWPGDIVFHYSTNARAVIGASVAGAPLEERSIVWIPHGTVGRSRSFDRSPRPGWWLPLYHYTPAKTPLKLTDLQVANEEAWLRAWVEGRHGSLALPFQMYPGKIRGAQGYLTKMPKAFVDRWKQLGSLRQQLETAQERFSPATDAFQPPAIMEAWTAAEFRPKSDSDYTAIISGGVQRRSRAHETLVRTAGDLLIAAGAAVSTPHPRDMLVFSPVQIIIEAKILGARHPGFAVRDAVGQLLEYRHFLGPKEAQLCILLDGNPGDALVHYVEDVLGFRIIWLQGTELKGGPATVEALLALNLGKLGSSAASV